MHNLSASFVLGYHGCDRASGESLLQNERFRPSENSYDWLGSGVYFWEANPDRALDWARRRANRKRAKEDLDLEAYVVGAAIDLGLCLDLISANGSRAAEFAYASLHHDLIAAGGKIPENSGGEDLLHRKLDCMVINYLHQLRKISGEQPFDTVRAVFTEGEPLYPTSGFRRKTHIQICVRNHECIKGVFRVPNHHFS
jgi:hypothetical protein